MAVDQEGGRVKTVPWAPPTLPPARIGARAREQGRRTGAALRALGVNVDLAPVADLPASRASAVYRQGRTWSFDAQETARRAAAFARGLRGGRVVATTKHFSGLGVARRDTDRALVRISGAKRRLAGPGPVPSGVSRPRAGAGTASFTDRSYDIGDQPVTGIALFPATGDVYAATDFDVLRLPAGASHWETAGSGLPTAAVYGLTLSQSANVLYAATHGRGAWALTLPRP